MANTIAEYKQEFESLKGRISTLLTQNTKVIDEAIKLLNENEATKINLVMSEIANAQQRIEDSNSPVDDKIKAANEAFRFEQSLYETFEKIHEAYKKVEKAKTDYEAAKLAVNSHLTKIITATGNIVKRQAPADKKPWDDFSIEVEMYSLEMGDDTAFKTQWNNLNVEKSKYDNLIEQVKDAAQKAKTTAEQYLVKDMEKMAQDELLLVKALMDAAREGKSDLFKSTTSSSASLDSAVSEAPVTNKVVSTNSASDKDSKFDDFVNSYYVYEYGLTPWKDLLPGLDDLALNDNSVSGYLLTFCLRYFDFNNQFLEYLYFFNHDQRYNTFALNFEGVNKKIFANINDFLDSDLAAEKFVEMLSKNYKLLKDSKELFVLYNYFFDHYGFFSKLRNGMRIKVGGNYLSETPVKEQSTPSHPYTSYLVPEEANYARNVRIFPFIELAEQPFIYFKAYYADGLNSGIDYDFNFNEAKVKRFYLPGKISLESTDSVVVKSINEDTFSFQVDTPLFEGFVPTAFEEYHFSKFSKGNFLVDFSFYDDKTEQVTYEILSSGNLIKENEQLRGTCLFRV